MNDPQGWNVVWQLDPEQIKLFIERDWFRYLFGGVPITAEFVDFQGRPLLSHLAPRALVCASIPNLCRAEAVVPYLRSLPRPRVLYHISDEFLDAGAELYRDCDLVIRNGSALFSGCEGINLLLLPLGYGTGFENSGGMGLPASQRQHCVAFMGKMKHERKNEMLPALQCLPGTQYVRETRNWADSLSNFNEASTSIYRQAVFVPCPKGNWNPECNRLYDALEWGCIPLIRNYNDTPYQDGYHRKLLGFHPLPEFDTWQELAAFARELLARAEELDALQEQVFLWWQGYKEDLRRQVESRLAELA